MTRIVLSFFAASLIALSMHAQAARELRVQLEASTNRDAFTNTAPLGAEVRWNVPYRAWSAVAEQVTIAIDVPGEFVSITSEEGTCVTQPSLRCTAPTNPDGWYHSITVVTRMNAGGMFSASATITSDAGNDADPSDNVAQLLFNVVDQPQLLVFGRFSDFVPHPGRKQTYFVDLKNTGSDARELTLRLTLPEGGTFVSAGEACTLSASEVICRYPTLAYFDSLRETLQIETPAKYDGADAVVHLELTTSRGRALVTDTRQRMVRHLLVTNTNDAGAGSLRQALLDSINECATTNCTIDFRIDAPSSGNAQIIEPLTALPPVAGAIEVDATAQREIFGQAIVLRGTHLAEGPGLLLGDGSIRIIGLEIRDFPGAGVELRTSTQYSTQGIYASQIIEHSVLANNDRGVALTDGCGIAVYDSTIIDNRRDGIFIGDGGVATIRNNQILRNGGSGIDVQFTYVVDRFTSAFIEDNVVANNGGWGIAYAEVGRIALRRNAIHDNGSRALDAGRDLTTGVRANDVTGVPNAPILLSATYNAVTGHTAVHGRLSSMSRDGNSFSVELFASSTAGEAAEYIAKIDSVSPGGEFTATVARDLRGSWITATNVRGYYVNIPLYSSFNVESSELSNAVQVEPGTKKGRAVRTAR